MNSTTFNSLPNNILAYWLSKNTIENFIKFSPLSEYADARNGFTTGSNDLFLRQWFEVENKNICYDATDLIYALYSGKKWFPYNKGGECKKWYGNQDYVIDWEKDGERIKKYGHLVPRSLTYMFFESVSWSKIASGNISFRYFPKGFMFDVAGLSLFVKEEAELTKESMIAFLNSKVCQHYLKAISPTLNFEVGQVTNLPIGVTHDLELEELVSKNLKTCKEDWDFYETSWNFKKHPLI